MPDTSDLSQQEIPFIEAEIDAVDGQMQTDGSVTFGLASMGVRGKKIQEIHNAIIGPLGTGIALTYASVVSTRQRVTCLLGAFIRLLRRIAWCEIIPAGPAQDDCLADAILKYNDDVAECDANHPV